MRVYIPVTFVGLRRAADSGALPSSGWQAHPLPDDDDADTAEDTALQAAADHSLVALRSEPEAPRRRAVVVANVPEEWLDAEPGGTVVLTRRIPVERFLAVYADPPESSSQVVAALNGRPGDDLGQMLWFARQELADLVT